MIARNSPVVAIKYSSYSIKYCFVSDPCHPYIGHPPSHTLHARCSKVFHRVRRIHKRDINNFPHHTYTYVPGCIFIPSVTPISPKRPFKLRQKRAKKCYTDYEQSSNQKE